MTPLEAVARLRAMVEQMTPEPWTVTAQPETPSLPLLAGPPKPNGKRDVVALFPLMTEPDVKEANGKGILALRNLAGPLLAVVEASLPFIVADSAGHCFECDRRADAHTEHCVAGKLLARLTALTRAVEETHGD